VEDFTLSVTKRDNIGSAHCRRYRANGEIPSVVYHRSESSISILLNTNEFVKIAKKTNASQVFKLKSNVKELDGRWVIVKDIALDYVKNSVNHVDLLTVFENELITVNVALNVVGEAIGVKAEGGILSIVGRELKVKCLPKDIPTSIDVDVSSLKLSQSIHASDINLPAGVSLAGDKKETIATVVGSRASRLMGQDVATTPVASTPTKPSATPAKK
jgi:large subunit ribosomal protein L25